MRISDWSSDVCSSDLMGDGGIGAEDRLDFPEVRRRILGRLGCRVGAAEIVADLRRAAAVGAVDEDQECAVARQAGADHCLDGGGAARMDRACGGERWRERGGEYV